MPLKNASIEVIRAFAPAADFGPVIPNTRKGTVVHVKPTRESVERAAETAPAGWVIFPQWVAGEPLRLEEVPRIDAFMQIATNAFNYELLGEPAFETVHALVASHAASGWCTRISRAASRRSLNWRIAMADSDPTAYVRARVLAALRGRKASSSCRRKTSTSRSVPCVGRSSLAASPRG